MALSFHGASNVVAMSSGAMILPLKRAGKKSAEAKASNANAEAIAGSLRKVMV